MSRLQRVPWELGYNLPRRAASRLRRMRILASHRHCTVRFEGPVYLGPGFYLDIPGNGSLIVGPRVQFRRGFTCEISGNGRVTIGEDCIFTWDTIIQCSTTIDILPGSWLGRTLIVDGNHRFRDPDRPVAEQGYDFQPLTIGPEAMIGNHAVVMNSVGKRTFVGANAVVTKPLPSFAVALGSPARVIETYGPSEAPILEDGSAERPDPEPAAGAA